MKHAAFNQPLLKLRAQAPRQGGFILLALLIIVTLMLFYVAASSRTLYQLQRELTALERTQVKRLTHSPTAAEVITVSPPNEVAPAKSPAP